jgi:MFS family permease
MTLKKWFRFYILFLLTIVVLSVLSDCFVLAAEPAGKATNVLLIVVRQFQGIAVGSLCSIVIFKRPGILDRRVDRRSLISYVLSSAILLTAFAPTVIPLTVGLFQSVLFAALMVLNLQGADNLTLRLLNNKWMRVVGVLS